MLKRGRVTRLGRGIKTEGYGSNNFIPSTRVTGACVVSGFGQVAASAIVVVAAVVAAVIPWRRSDQEATSH